MLGFKSRKRREAERQAYLASIRRSDDPELRQQVIACVEWVIGAADPKQVFRDKASGDAAVWFSWKTGKDGCAQKTHEAHGGEQWVRWAIYADDEREDAPWVSVSTRPSDNHEVKWMPGRGLDSVAQIMDLVRGATR